MTVGETLTEARYQAGLSIDELSERTRIRSTVIRSIEQDDYAACGGELYVRGYVRAIAGAVGIDALPLIREFDQAQLGGGDVPAAPGVAGVPGHDATRFDLPAVPAFDPPVDPDATRFDLPAVPGLRPACRSACRPGRDAVRPAADSWAASGRRPRRHGGLRCPARPSAGCCLARCRPPRSCPPRSRPPRRNRGSPRTRGSTCGR